MLHELKIDRSFAKDILYHNKTFEVRLNDREYKVGDIIHFTAMNIDNGKEEYEESPINYRFYKITYILPWFIGVKDEYVVFSIEPYNYEESKVVSVDEPITSPWWITEPIYPPMEITNSKPVSGQINSTYNQHPYD